MWLGCLVVTAVVDRGGSGVGGVGSVGSLSTAMPVVTIQLLFGRALHILGLAKGVSVYVFVKEEFLAHTMTDGDLAGDLHHPLVQSPQFRIGVRSLIESLAGELGETGLGCFVRVGGHFSLCQLLLHGGAINSQVTRQLVDKRLRHIAADAHILSHLLELTERGENLAGMREDTLLRLTTLDRGEASSDTLQHDRALWKAWLHRAFQLVPHAVDFSAEAAPVSDLERLELQLHFTQNTDYSLKVSVQCVFGSFDGLVPVEAGVGDDDEEVLDFDCSFWSVRRVSSGFVALEDDECTYRTKQGVVTG